jgi:hypothetical protein
MNDIPAFPLDIIYTQENVRFNGMTLRDYFAAKAMQAIMTRSPATPFSNVANYAYEQAKAMMEARTNGL